MSGIRKQKMIETRNGNTLPAKGKAPKTGNDSAINLVCFSTRLKALYSNWQDLKAEFWGSSDVLVVATPPSSDDLRYLKSSALNVWLLGYEFPETIMIFMNKQIHFLCNQNKASLLEAVRGSAMEAVGVEVVLHVKARFDDGTAQMDALLRAICAQSKSNPIVGYIAREASEGILLEAWAEKLKNSNLQLADITSGFSDLFAVKDHEEVTNVKKAAFLAATVMKNFVVHRLEKVIDEEEKVAHSVLANDTKKAILGLTKLKKGNIDICYPPIFQSGGNFDLWPSASSDDEFLYYKSASAIICAIGCRYNSYCSNVARTFLIDFTPTQGKAYEVLLRAHEAVISALNPGNKVSAAYQAALSVVERDAPELVPNLTKSAGTGIGLEFCESGSSLNAKNDRVLKPGMVFNVTLGFQNLEAQTNNPKSHNFSLLLADIVIVTEKGPDVATALSSKSVKDVAYSLIEVEEEEEEEPPKAKSESNGTENLYSKATLRSDNHVILKEELRRQQLQTLRRNVLARESGKAERAALVSEEKLVIGGNKFKPIKLIDLWIMPTFGGCERKLSGILEAHSNGFLYSTSRPGECVVIMYGNIKHAFFQAAEKEMIAVVHFHLHNHIMVGTKKTKDVQFYAEVTEVVQTLWDGKGEIVEEQWERDRRNKINLDFQNFVNRMNDLWGQTQFKGLNLEFDQPLMELGFCGVPYQTSAFIVPTSSCLVELIKNPCLVVILSEIEIVNLERVGLGQAQANFDMAIMFKDKRNVLRIGSIPSTSLDGIKEWLDTIDIKYYESAAPR
ncbi:hypothetical protein Vadar_017225 [Vaccinium darrowii]|uniref:Uncharacterized protein n=1 Tax=Vaccinium darrowii TaxID=229202 RepID=A0ACB7Y795_9ERIC|nr:hypothetical protein Vadar_017225 [Vaccinium darrowii]